MPKQAPRPKPPKKARKTVAALPPSPPTTDPHRWGPWFGAPCEKCGAPDMGALAVLTGDLEPFSWTWKVGAPTWIYTQVGCEVSDAVYAMTLYSFGLPVPPDLLHLIQLTPTG